MTPGLRTLAFGELESTGTWGAAWIAGRAGEAALTLGAGHEGSAVAGGGRLAAEHDDGEWRLDGSGVNLVLAPVGEPVATRAPADEVGGWTQLCRVSGGFDRDGAGHSVDCLGVRTWWPDAIDVGGYQSVRVVSTWFEPEDALTVTAFRPRRSKGHDKDVLAAAVISPESSAPVEDPRLSTTYAAGWPMRAGLELWLAGEDPERPYPRRAAGEATGARAQVRDGRFELRAEPFRWHTRGRDGAGMYLLAQLS